MSEVIVGHLTPMDSKCEWKIPNFRSYAMSYKNGECLYSPILHTHYNSPNSTDTINLQWRLRIFPSGLEKTLNNYISVFVENCNDFKVAAKYSFIISGQSHIKLIRVGSEANKFEAKGIAGSSWGWREFVEREVILSERSKFLASGNLTISYCLSEVRIFSDIYRPVNQSCLDEFSRFENLLESGKFGDVTFNIGEKKMQLHKAILTGASPVFQAMFDYDMKEQKDSVVNIVDIDFEVMKEMFRFIYAKKVNKIENIAGDLFVAADKYCLIELKQLCEKSLCDNWNADSALQYLELAVRFDAKKLKSKTVDYIVKNLKEIVLTKEFLALNIDCKNELFISMANN